MKSKQTIEKQLQKKKNMKLVETIILAKKNKAWLEVASILSGPKRNRKNINLNELNKELKEKEILVVPGKVLSQGDIDKKGKVVALAFSKKAEEKLLNAKVEVSGIFDEIKKNPEGKGIRILK